MQCVAAEKGGRNEATTLPGKVIHSNSVNDSGGDGRGLLFLLLLLFDLFLRCYRGSTSQTPFG